VNVQPIEHHALGAAHQHAERGTADREAAHLRAVRREVYGHGGALRIGADDLHLVGAHAPEPHRFAADDHVLRVAPRRHGDERTRRRRKESVADRRPRFVSGAVAVAAGICDVDMLRRGIDGEVTPTALSARHHRAARVFADGRHASRRTSLARERRRAAVFAVVHEACRTSIRRYPRTKTASIWKRDFGRDTHRRRVARDGLGLALRAAHHGCHG
jgi:hypothetical protein